MLFELPIFALTTAQVQQSILLLFLISEVSQKRSKNCMCKNICYCLFLALVYSGLSQLQIVNRINANLGSEQITGMKKLRQIR